MIIVRDLEFRSTAEAAAWFGVTERHVRNLRSKVRLDSLGLGKGWLKGKTVKRRPETYMPVAVRGLLFETAHDCARHFGIKPCTVYSLVAAGRADQIGLGSGVGCGGNRSRPFSIGGVTYPSQKAASIALGLRARYISDALHGRRHASMDRVLAAAMALEAAKLKARVEADRRAAASALREDPSCAA